MSAVDEHSVHYFMEFHSKMLKLVPFHKGEGAFQKFPDPYLEYHQNLINCWALLIRTKHVTQIHPNKYT